MAHLARGDAEKCARLYDPERGLEGLGASRASEAVVSLGHVAGRAMARVTALGLPAAPLSHRVLLKLRGGQPHPLARARQHGEAELVTARTGHSRRLSFVPRGCMAAGAGDTVLLGRTVLGKRAPLQVPGERRVTLHTPAGPVLGQRDLEDVIRAGRGVPAVSPGIHLDGVAFRAALDIPVRQAMRRGSHVHARGAFGKTRRGGCGQQRTGEEDEHGHGGPHCRRDWEGRDTTPHL